MYLYKKKIQFFVCICTVIKRLNCICLLFPTVQHGAPEAGGGPGGRHHQVGVAAHQGGCWGPARHLWGQLAPPTSRPLLRPSFVVFTKTFAFLFCVWSDCYEQTLMFLLLFVGFCSCFYRKSDPSSNGKNSLCTLVYSIQMQKSQWVWLLAGVSGCHTIDGTEQALCICSFT